MPIEIPKLDPENEDLLAAAAIGNLPAQVTDRNPSSIEVKLIEGVATFYGLLSYFADQLSPSVRLEVLARAGLVPAGSEGIEDVEARASHALDAGNRAIRDVDFARLAVAIERLPGVRRAYAVGDGSSVVVVHIIADDLNETPSAALRDDVRSALDAATVPGVAVVVAQAPLRLLGLDSIEVAYIDGFDKSVVQANLAAAFSEAVNVDTWDYGAALHYGDLVGVFSAVEGVKRIGEISIGISDDYTWVWPVFVDLSDAPIAPKPFGLLHDFALFLPGMPTFIEIF